MRTRGQSLAGPRSSAPAVRRTLTGVFACLICLFALAPAALADDFSHVLSVQFADDATARDRAAARAEVDATYLQSLAAPGLQQIEIPRGDSADAAPAAHAAGHGRDGRAVVWRRLCRRKRVVGTCMRQVRRAAI